MEIQQVTPRRTGPIGPLLLSGVAMCALLWPPAAKATCVSIAGSSVGTGCSSSLSGIAIGLGPDAKAEATGWFNTAVSIGTAAKAFSQGNGNLSFAAGFRAVAATNGSLQIAAVAGTYSEAVAGQSPADAANIAVMVGDYSEAVASGNGTEAGYANRAWNFGSGITGTPNRARAIGRRNWSLNVGGPDNVAEAVGVANKAVNLGGSHNVASAAGRRGSRGAAHNAAFNILGSRNQAIAGAQPSGGPLAVAGNVGGRGKVTAQASTGIKIR